MRTMNAPARDKKIVYDLLPDWIFWDENVGGARRLDELEVRARSEPRITGHAILGDSLRTKSVRVLVAISTDGLSLWDVKTHVAHRWAAKAPQDLTGLGEALRALRGRVS